jgi:hypothetical protein
MELKLLGHCAHFNLRETRSGAATPSVFDQLIHPRHLQVCKPCAELAREIFAGYIPRQVPVTGMIDRRAWTRRSSTNPLLNGFLQVLGQARATFLK